jgi:glycosyltransferase involved in cell wall biosynthesis
VEKQLSQRGLRVYVLTPSFPPTDGGQEKHLLELSESLIAAGATVQVFTRRVNRGYLAAEILGSVPVTRFTPFGEIKGVGMRAAPRLGLLLGKMIWRLLRDSKKYDIVLVSGFNFVPFSAVFAGTLSRKPCVVRPESPLEVAEPLGAASRRKMGLSEHSIAVRILRALRRLVARRVERYVAISLEIRTRLEHAGIDAARIIAIPNGIDVGRFAPVGAPRKRELRRAMSLPVEALMMIYTGRLAASKGVMMLIDVWRELAGDYPAAHLLIVGTGRGSFDDCEAALHEYIARHAMSTRVTLAGAVSNVQEYLQASDMFVFPSDYEGFSLSILEAMTAALPLVSTRVGIAAELEDQCRFGLLVPPQDRSAFRDALSNMLANPAQRTEMGANARAAVSERFSLSAEARRYCELFTELVERP